jgi:hypothetical protein
MLVTRGQWEPAAFYQWYERLPVDKRKMAWGDLKRHERKVYIEWKTIQAFARASGLDIDPRSIETCDPNTASPPLPDICCLVSGLPAYFELGEVTDEGLARIASIAEKNRESVYGGVLLQRQPLVRDIYKEVPESLHDERASAASGSSLRCGSPIAVRATAERRCEEMALSAG